MLRLVEQMFIFQNGSPLGKLLNGSNLRIRIVNQKPSTNSVIFPTDVNELVPWILALEKCFYQTKMQAHISFIRPYFEPTWTNGYACLIGLCIPARLSFRVTQVLGSKQCQEHYSLEFSKLICFLCLSRR